MIFFQHLSRSFKPTDVWYENEHKELMQLDSPKQGDSPVLAYKRGNHAANGGTFNKNITEV